MTLRTNEFALTRRAYSRWLLIKNLRTRWWPWAILLLITVIGAVQNPSSYLPRILLVWLVILALNAAFFAWMVYAPAQRRMFTRRHYEFDDQFLSYLNEDGRSGRVNLDSLHQVYETSDCTLLYETRGKAHFIPCGAFETDADLEQFRDLLRAHHWLKASGGK
jgi:hypothetical protein